MARNGSLTYEAVEQAANELRGAGVSPTVRLLVEKVGGSNTTVLKYLTAWKAANPPAKHQVREMPLDIVVAVESALNRAEAAARSEIQTQLVEMQATLKDISAENEDLQERNAGLVEANAGIASERDTLKGQLAEQTTELRGLREAVSREQAAAEAARVELAKAQLLVDGADTRVAEIQERERETRHELVRVQAEFTSLRESRASAEQRAAVVEAQLEAERGAREASEARLTALQQDLQMLTASVGRAAAAEATAAELRSTVGMLQDLLKRAQEQQGLQAGATAVDEPAGRTDAGEKGGKRR